MRLHLLIQSAWRGHRARLALHMMIDHMTNLLLSKGMDVLKEVSEIDNEKKVIGRSRMIPFLFFLHKPFRNSSYV